MRLFLTFAILVIVSSIQFGEGGIYRRYVRRSRPRPPILHDRLGIGRRADFQQPFGFYGRPFSFLRRPVRSSWNFIPSRVPRRLRYHHHNQRSDNNQRVPHFHHQQQPSHYPGPLQYRSHPGGRSKLLSMPVRWGPFSNGNPIVRDPTFDYAPPTMDQVRLIPESRNRRTHPMGGTPPPNNYAFNPYQQHHHQRPPPPPPAAYRPSASLWKMLAHKQRPKRPYPPPHNSNQIPHHHHHQPGMRYHGQSPSSPLYHHQAEIVPKLTNMVMFKPTDVVSPVPGGGFRRPAAAGPGKSSTNSQGIGSVSSVPLYSHEQTSSSEIRPVTVVKPTVGGSKEYIFTVVGYKGPSAPATSPIPQQPLPSSSTTPKAEITSSTAAPSTTTTSTAAPSTTRRSPILHAVKTTPVTISSTHNSAVKPFEPTESLGNNYNTRHPSHKNDEEDEEDEDESSEESIVQEQVIKPNENKKNQGTTGNKILDNIFSLLDMVPPEPVYPVRSFNNSFNIGTRDRDEDEGDEVSDEDNKDFIKKLPESVSVQTSTSMSVSISKDKVTTTPKTPLSTKRPLTSPTRSPVRITSTPKKAVETTTTTQPSTTTSEEPSTTSKAPKFANLPAMPKYTKTKPKSHPVYAKKNTHSHKNMNKPLGKYSSASSSSALSKEMNGSGEIVVITGGRSKVKEYKPQFLAENSGLLAFDKVASESSSTSSSVVSSTSASPSGTSTTTKSPLQEFDPMQLIHSWFTKSD